MHTHTKVGLVVALLAASVPERLVAQRGFRGSAAGGFRGGLPAMPRAPMARSPGAMGARFEPGRPVSAVPYVRDGQWYGHAAVDDARFRLQQPFAQGRFTRTGPTNVFNAGRVDLGTRRVWLPGGPFQIADSDWAVTAPWCWTCDQFVVYDDPDHPGWYLMYDARMGEYVHAQYLGN
jgi:hypothetical protein